MSFPRQIKYFVDGETVEIFPLTHVEMAVEAYSQRWSVHGQHFAEPGKRRLLLDMVRITVHTVPNACKETNIRGTLDALPFLLLVGGSIVPHVSVTYRPWRRRLCSRHIEYDRSVKAISHLAIGVVCRTLEETLVADQGSELYEGRRWVVNAPGVITIDRKRRVKLPHI
jgi:hypothetical protein